MAQYRGAVLPLFRLSSLLGEAPSAGDSAGTLQVVVCADEGRRVGLVVDRILDVVESDAEPHGPTGRGLVGTAILQDRVTDLLDIPALVGACA